MIYQIKLLKCFNYGFVPPLELSCATHFTFSESWFFKFPFEQSVTSVGFEWVIPDYVKESARLYKLYNILDPGKTTNKNKIWDYRRLPDLNHTNK
jgi:hypothetical protein